MTIRTRIIIGLFVIVAVGFYYLTNWVVSELRPHYLKSMEESLVDIATVLSSSVAIKVAGDSIPVNDLRKSFNDALKRTVNARIYDLKKEQMNLRVYTTNSKGIVIFDSDSGRDEGRDYSQWNDVYRSLRGEYGARSTRMVKNDSTSSVLYIGSPIICNGKIVGELTVCKPTKSVEQFIENSRNKVIIGGFLAACAVVIVGIVLSIWVTGPIRKLTRYALFAKSNKNTQFPKLGTFSRYGHSEVGIMGKALEEMREALEGKKYVENYVQLLTHEIKSPLSAIRGAAELLEENMPVEKREHFLNNIRNESMRIQDIIDRLLQLSLIENRRELKDVNQIDMSAVVKEVIDSLSPQFEKKEIAIQLSAQANVIIAGESFLIRQAIANLLQNALDFSLPGGTVTVGVQKINQICMLIISDCGTGIPDYAKERIFERFYSLARPDTNRKSTGLGLSFVRETATLHRGAIALSNNPGGGVSAQLEFPSV